MKAQWLEVWRIRYQMKRVLIDDKTWTAAGEEWDEPVEECVLSGRDGQRAVAMLREAMLATLFDAAEDEVDASLTGKRIYTDFRLLKLEHLARAALFPGVVKGPGHKETKG